MQREDYTQVFTFYGRKTHLVRPSDSLNGFYPDAICGLQSDPFSPFFGTGDQKEYDRAASLPLCKSCEKRMM